jgi:hypothetical protein
MERGDEHTERVITVIIASPHKVTLCLPKNATVERIIESFKKRTGIDGTWEGRITSEGIPRIVEIVPIVQPTVPYGPSRVMEETHIFFGTLEHKALFDSLTTPKEALAQATRNLKLGDDWLMEKSMNKSKKFPRTVIPKWTGEKPIRQALPTSITSFIATYVEKRRKIASPCVKCEGGESPDRQAELVSRACTKTWEISDSQEEDDHEIHLQCSRMAFAPIRFVMDRQTIDSWQQTSATNKQGEKLASVLFGERVTLKRQLYDDGEILVYEMVPHSQRYVKPKDTRIKTRQPPLPGTSIQDHPIHMPVETRAKWGDCFRQTYMVDGVKDDSKIVRVYDPTQREFDVDPDVEAEVLGHDRVVPGDVVVRDVTWTGPTGVKIIIYKLKVPVKATRQDLIFRISLDLKCTEIDESFFEIFPEEWAHAKILAVSFVYERPEISSLVEVTPNIFKIRFVPKFPVFVETDGACAGNQVQLGGALP